MHGLLLQSTGYNVTAGKLRAGGSIVFWLGIGAVAVYLVHAAMAVGRGADPWQAARKALLMALFVVIPVVYSLFSAKGALVAEEA